MKVALDTNILGYAEGVNGSEMKRAALDLMGRLPRDEVLIPVQALGELLNVLRGRQVSRGTRPEP